MISKLLSTAVKLYLRSQVKQVENLQVKIVGRDRQILQGYIPQIFLSCTHAEYRGLCLSQVELNGSDIAFSLLEVVKRKPLKLLEPVFVQIQLKIDAAGLQASLDSPLFQSGLDDLWQMVLSAQTNILAEWDRSTIKWSRMAIANNKLNLFGTHQGTFGEVKELCLSAGIELANNHTLCLYPLQIVSESCLVDELEKELKIDLGTDVAIEQLSVESEHIMCLGKIKVNS